MEPAKLALLLRGELDWIARKSLDKDRGRRYATANDLARDLRRYLADEPVEAGAPSTAYRLRKYARRHCAALATAGVFAAVLVAASTISAWQAVRATGEEAKARRAEVEAKAVLGFFRDKVLAAARPEGQEGGLGSKVSLREAIDAAESSIAGEFSTQPRLEAAIRDTMGTSYLYLGDLASAIRQYDRAVTLRTEELGPKHPDTLSSMDNLAVAYRRAGRTDEAIPLLQAVLAGREATLGIYHTDTLTSMNNLAVAYQFSGRIDEAVVLHEREFQGCRASLGPDAPDTMISMNNLAAGYKAAGRPEEAVPFFEAVLARRKATLSPDHPDTLTSINNLAATYQVIGRTTEAISFFEDMLARRKRMLDQDHPDTLQSKSNLALAYRDAGRIGDAIALFKEVLEQRRGKLDPGHPDTLKSMGNLAAAYLEAERWADAEALLRECLRLREKTTPDDWLLFLTMSQLGASLAGRGNAAEAEPLLINGYEGMAARESKIPPHRKRELRVAAARIVPFYEGCGKTEQARAWRRRLAAAALPDRSHP